MIFTYYYKKDDYEGALKPLSLIKKQLHLAELMRKSNDPDYPINRCTTICLLEEESGTILNVSVYTERDWIPSYMRCEKIKAEMLVGIRNKDEKKVKRIQKNIDAILRKSDIEIE